MTAAGHQREQTAWRSFNGMVGAGLADLPGHPARQVAWQHKEDVQAWLAGMLAKFGVRSIKERAKEIQLLLEGAGALMLITGDRGYSDVAAKAARRLL
jgi:hypothetical protein